MTKADLEELVRFFAGILVLAPHADLRDEDRAPTGKLLNYQSGTVMQLDWAFCGELRPLFRKNCWEQSIPTIILLGRSSY